MEAYKQKKDEEAMNLKKEEEEMLKLQKQEALQLLKKKEKTENIIKVKLIITFPRGIPSCLFVGCVSVD